MLRSHRTPLGSVLAIAAILVAACGGTAGTAAPSATPVASTPAASLAVNATESPAASTAPAESAGPVGSPVPGERLLFGVRSADGSTADIYSELPDGSDLRQLTSGSGNHLCPGFSRDAHTVVYCSDESGPFEIWTMQADGSNQAQLTKLGGRALFPDLSPDGATVAFAGTEGSDTHNEIYLVDAATGAGLVTLTSCAGGKEGCANDYPEFSPDGKQIVFIHQDDYSGDNGINQQVWVMNVDGSDAHAVTTGAEPKDQLPTWSPDGKSIAYASGKADSEGIWVVGADGTNPRQLSGCKAADEAPCAAGSDFGPGWSPDGTSIVFARGFSAVGANDRPIFLMKADGTDQRRLTPDPMLVGVPTWR